MAARKVEQTDFFMWLSFDTRDVHTFNAIVSRAVAATRASKGQ